MKKNDSELCEWSDYGEDGAWESACGKVFYLLDGNPWKNGMRYCLRCGKPMFKSVLAARSKQRNRAASTNKPMPVRKAKPKPCLCDSCDVACLIYAGEVTECSGYKKRGTVWT